MQSNSSKVIKDAAAWPRKKMRTPKWTKELSVQSRSVDRRNASDWKSSRRRRSRRRKKRSRPPLKKLATLHAQRLQSSVRKEQRSLRDKMNPVVRGTPSTARTVPRCAKLSIRPLTGVSGILTKNKL